MSAANQPETILMLGGGGHASVIADIFRAQGMRINGIVSPALEGQRKALSGIRHYLKDDDVLEFRPEECLLVNGIGSLPGEALRRKLFEHFRNEGYRFLSVVSSTAIVSPYAKIGEGAQILQGAIVQAGAVIGDNTIINSGAIIEHDCVIGANNHIAPGAVLSGQVTTGDQVHVGTGANIIQSVQIGRKVVIGAGAVVTSHIQDGMTVYPARSYIKEGKHER